ncbi:MAG: response regulator [Chloroflexi bacterium]|nr:response regulator [Chloroflexota bacterium]
METLPKGKVLVVDDDQDLTKLLVMMLGGVGFQAEGVYTGQAALEWLKRERPIAIILDIMMPDISGFTILQQLRSDDSTAELPIVMLSSQPESTGRPASLAAGADAYFAKPATARQLADELKSLLAKRATRKLG